MKRTRLSKDDRKKDMATLRYSSGKVLEFTPVHWRIIFSDKIKFDYWPTTGRFGSYPNFKISGHGAELLVTIAKKALETKDMQFSDLEKIAQRVCPHKEWVREKPDYEAHISKLSGKPSIVHYCPNCQAERIEDVASPK